MYQDIGHWRQLLSEALADFPAPQGPQVRLQYCPDMLGSPLNPQHLHNKKLTETSDFCVRHLLSKLLSTQEPYLGTETSKHVFVRL